MMTNGTRYVAVGGEVVEYYRSVSGYAYSLAATILLGKVACSIFGTPSGETHLTYYGFLESSCRFASDSRLTVAK